MARASLAKNSSLIKVIPSVFWFQKRRIGLGVDHTSVAHFHPAVVLLLLGVASAVSSLSLYYSISMYLKGGREN